MPIINQGNSSNVSGFNNAQIMARMNIQYRRPAPSVVIMQVPAVIDPFQEALRREREYYRALSNGSRFYYQPPVSGSVTVIVPSQPIVLPVQPVIIAGQVGANQSPNWIGGHNVNRPVPSSVSSSSFSSGPR